MGTGVVEIGKVVGVLPDISHLKLDFGSCEMGPVACKEILDAIVSLKKLTNLELNLYKNKLEN